MKLLRHTPKQTESPETEFIITEEISSGDVEELKSKAADLCQREKLGVPIWATRYPLMGSDSANPDTEWKTQLNNGIFFSIEK
ncbi:hypothetical protein [Ottowia oryzae]